MKATGLTLLLLGIALTIFTSIRFFTKEKVVDLGVIEITRDKPNDFSWSPVMGIVVMGIGGVILWQASKKQ
jgi:hypothetical protein